MPGNNISDLQKENSEEKVRYLSLEFSLSSVDLRKG